MFLLHQVLLDGLENGTRQTDGQVTSLRDKTVLISGVLELNGLAVGRGVGETSLRSGAVPPGVALLLPGGTVGGLVGIAVGAIAVVVGV